MYRLLKFEHKFRQRGFTLIEVIVTIAILGLMAAAFIPLLSNSMSGIFRTGQQEAALYQAQNNLENKSGSSTEANVIINESATESKTVSGMHLKTTSTVSGQTVSLYFFYVPEN